MSITILGLGAGDISQISFGAVKELESGKKIYLRTENHPIISQLNIEYENFDSYYNNCENFEEVYQSIAEKIIKLGSKSDIIYAVPGHPRVAESTVTLIEKYAYEKNIKINIIASMSFVDAIYSYLGFDPSEGFRLLDAFSISKKDLDFNSNIIITQVYDRYIASNVKIKLMDYYNDEQEIWLVRSAGIKNQEYKKKLKLCELDRAENEFDHLTSLYIPKTSEKRFQDIFDLIEVTKTLRGKNGCPWDKRQTHRSLTKYLIEESYELIDSIEKDDIEGMIEELGDLLYHIVLHSQIGIEEGFFDFDEVCDSITKKMISRHPHVFDTKRFVNYDKDFSWEKNKMEEKGEKKISEGIRRVPKSLPALIKAEKIQSKAAKVGFDWSDIEDVFSKVKEEYDEFYREYLEKNHKKTQEEFGDLIFALVNLARFLKIDPEYALNLTNTKFMDRFEYVEDKIIASKKSFDEVDLETMDSYWNESKNKINKNH